MSTGQSIADDLRDRERTKIKCDEAHLGHRREARIQLDTKIERSLDELWPLRV